MDSTLHIVFEEPRWIPLGSSIIEQLGALTVRMPVLLRRALLIGPVLLAARVASYGNHLWLKRLRQLPELIDYKVTPEEARETLPLLNKNIDHIREHLGKLESRNQSDFPEAIKRWLVSAYEVLALQEQIALQLKAVSMLDARRSELLFLPPQVSQLVTEISFLRANAEGYFEREEVKEWLNSPHPLSK